MGTFIGNDVIIVVFEGRVFEKSVNIVAPKVKLPHFMFAFDSRRQAFFVQKISKNGMKWSRIANAIRLFVAHNKRVGIDRTFAEGVSQIFGCIFYCEVNNLVNTCRVACLQPKI